MNESGTMQFMHPDHLGSTSLITDSAGNTVEETTYYPFGLTLSGGSAESKLYTGQELDGTDLYYYGARYYNPSLRSFVQPDPIIANVYNPQNLNRYSYVLNNPYKYVDPDGEIVITASVLVGSFLVVSALTTLTSTAITHIEYSQGDIIKLKDGNFLGIITFGESHGTYYNNITIHIGINKEDFKPSNIDKRLCSKDEDCIKVKTKCCRDSAYYPYWSINQIYEEEYEEEFDNSCEKKSPCSKNKAKDWTGLLSAKPRCTNNKCELFEEEVEKNESFIIGEIGLRQCYWDAKKEITFYNKTYLIESLIDKQGQKFSFTINGERFEDIEMKELIQLEDGAYFAIVDVVWSEAGGCDEPDLMTFYLGIYEEDFES